MADKPATAAKAPDPISVQNEKVQKDAAARELQEEIDRESQEQEAKAKGLAQTAAPVATLKPTTQMQVVLQPALVSRSGSASPISRLEEANTAWALGFKHCPTAELAMNCPELLWRVNGKIKRFDTILLHDEFFAWEVLVRVMVIDKELQCVFVDQIGPVLEHRPPQVRIDFSKMTVVNRGAIGKWSIVAEAETSRSRVIQQGFETEAQAQAWLTKKKAA